MRGSCCSCSPSPVSLLAIVVVLFSVNHVQTAAMIIVFSRLGRSVEGGNVPSSKRRSARVLASDSLTVNVDRSLVICPANRAVFNQPFQLNSSLRATNLLVASANCGAAYTCIRCSSRQRKTVRNRGRQDIRDEANYAVSKCCAEYEHCLFAQIRLPDENRCSRSILFEFNGSI